MTDIKHVMRTSKSEGLYAKRHPSDPNFAFPGIEHPQDSFQNRLKKAVKQTQALPTEIQPFIEKVEQRTPLKPEEIRLGVERVFQFLMSFKSQLWMHPDDKMTSRVMQALEAIIAEYGSPEPVSVLVDTWRLYPSNHALQKASEKSIQRLISNSKFPLSATQSESNNIEVQTQTDTLQAIFWRLLKPFETVERGKRLILSFRYDNPYLSI